MPPQSPPLGRALGFACQPCEPLEYGRLKLAADPIAGNRFATRSIDRGPAADALAPPFALALALSFEASSLSGYLYGPSGHANV